MRSPTVSASRVLPALGRRVDLRYDLAVQPAEIPVATVGGPSSGNWTTPTPRLRR